MSAATTRPSDRRQLASFVVTGGTAALVNLASRWLLSFVVVYELAVILAYLIGLNLAFVLARRYVFTSTGHWLGEYCRFALVNVFSFLIVLGVSSSLARAIFPMMGFTWHVEDVAHFIGVASPILISYYLHKYYSFGKRTQRA